MTTLSGPGTRRRERFEPEAAIDRLTSLYETATQSLKQALEAFLKDRLPPSPERRQQFCYPKLSVTYNPEGPQPSDRLAPMPNSKDPGVYSTTITQPRHFRPYLLEQLELSGPATMAPAISVGISDQEIPYPYVFDKGDELDLGGVRAQELAHHFPAPAPLRGRR